MNSKIKTHTNKTTKTPKFIDFPRRLARPLCAAGTGRPLRRSPAAAIAYAAALEVLG